MVEHKFFDLLKEKQKKNHEFVATILDTVDALVSVIDSNGHFITFNRACEELSGYSFAEVKERPLWDFLLVPEEADSVKSVLSRLKGEEPSNRFTNYWLTKDGQRRLIEWSNATVNNSDGSTEYIISTGIDITDRRYFEEKLQYRAELEQFIAEISTEFINLPSEKIVPGIEKALMKLGQFSGVDRTYIFLFNNKLTEMRCICEWCAGGIEPQIQYLQNVSIAEYPWFEERIKKLEVIHIPRVADLPEEAEAEKEEFQRENIQSLIDVPIVSGQSLMGFLGFETVRKEMSLNDDYITLLRIAGEIFANALQRKNTDEILKNYSDHLEEQVELRTRELREAHAELVQKERLAVLGQLTATVNHDIRNPLGTISNALFSIDDALKRNEMQRVTRALKLAERNVQRCEGILGELTDFTRKGELKIEPTDIDRWLGDILDEQELPENIQFRRRLNSGIILPIDREQLRRVVLNVFTNAVHAMQENGVPGNTLTVKTYAYKERLQMAFIDIGSGIPEEIKGKISEPLFTTKSLGVGLGMSIVENIMKKHGGGVEIESQAGRGTTVTLWLALQE